MMQTLVLLAGARLAHALLAELLALGSWPKLVTLDVDPDVPVCHVVTSGDGAASIRLRARPANDRHSDLWAVVVDLQTEDGRPATLQFPLELEDFPGGTERSDRRFSDLYLKPAAAALDAHINGRRQQRNP